MGDTLLTSSEGNGESEQKLAVETEEKRISFKSFLEQTPPDSTILISDFTRKKTASGEYLDTPDLLLYCESEDCAGPRMFQCRDSLYIQTEWTTTFLKYICRNCGKRLHRFAILYKVQTIPNGSAMKFGQLPQFGPNTPSGLIRLIEADRELFLQGRRAENRGMGIGAFAYYRRVVENQRNQIIEKALKLQKRLVLHLKLIKHLLRR